MRTWRLLSPLVSLAALAGLASCGNGPPSATSGGVTGSFASPTTSAASPVIVHETDQLKFAPVTAAVKAGGVVEWINDGTVSHNVTFDGGPASDTMQKSDAFELKFTTPGTYDYVCTFHVSSGMKGTVVVI